MFIHDGQGGANVANVGANGGLDVNIQDQTSPTLIIPMSTVNNTTTITSPTVIDTYEIVVDTTTGFVDGAFIVLADPTNARYYHGKQVGAISTKTVTLDTPLDFAYPTDTQVTNGSTDMAVDGSVTPVVFSLRASDTTPAVPVVIDITRLLFHCTCTNSVDLSKFADQVALTNGVVCRRRGDYYSNIFNVKTNAEMAGLMFDWTPYASTNPNQGVDGFIGRLTFAGASKMGVTLRIGEDEDLDILIQDDLTTTITSFKTMVEGHIVVPN